MGPPWERRLMQPEAAPWEKDEARARCPRPGLGGRTPLPITPHMKISRPPGSALKRRRKAKAGSRSWDFTSTPRGAFRGGERQGV